MDKLFNVFCCTWCCGDVELLLLKSSTPQVSSNSRASEVTVCFFSSLDPEVKSEKEEFNVLQFLAFQDNLSQLNKDDEKKLGNITTKLMKKYNDVSQLIGHYNISIFYYNETTHCEPSAVPHTS